MAHRRLPKTCYHSPKGRAETGAPLPLNKLLLGAKQVPIRKELPWHTTPQKASYPLVEFYDTSQDAARFPGGQFVSRYYMTDLLEDDSIAVSIDTMLKNGNQFSLDGGIPAWTVEGDDLAKVNDFLKKSCMEFCGSLPGDDKGEDGYSLTGEARDAATSRNELNENRKSVAEMIQECFDSIENNGDAI